MSALLDENVLTEFVGALRAKGIRAADHLLPGLSNAEIDTIAADAGIELSVEGASLMALLQRHGRCCARREPGDRP